MLFRNFLFKIRIRHDATSWHNFSLTFETQQFDEFFIGLFQTFFPNEDTSAGVIQKVSGIIQA